MAESNKIGPIYGLGVIAAAGIAGGLVDAIYFSTKALLDDRSPVKVLQGIAGFWLGKAAFDGGVMSACLGLATHFGLATIMASAFFVLAALFPQLRRQPVLAGLIYGLILYGVMYFVVLPLRWPAIYPRFQGLASVPDILAHIGVGLAIALVVSRALGRR
jgi:uncharacterized membrane protein YagU involved in acid resistance